MQQVTGVSRFGVCGRCAFLSLVALAVSLSVLFIVPPGSHPIVGTLFVATASGSVGLVGLHGIARVRQRGIQPRPVP
jgi:hypothetical protein